MGGEFHPRPILPVLWQRECRTVAAAIATVGGIQKIGTRDGFHVRLYEDCEALLKREPGVQSVIVIGFEWQTMASMIERLRSANKRIVLTNADTDQMDGYDSCVTYSRRLITEQMLDYLTAKQCRRIALVGCDGETAGEQAYADALKAYLASHPEISGESFFYRTHLDESFTAFARVYQRFDAVLCPTAFAGVAFLRFCSQHALRVPQDFLVASIRDGEINRYCKPSITSMALDFAGIGEQAVGVWKYQQDPANGSFRMRIAAHGQIVPRESTGEAPFAETFTTVKTNMPVWARGGNLFYKDPSFQALMQLDCCLQGCDELDLRIIGLLLAGDSYETICEKLFLSESSLQYRVRKLFHATAQKSRRGFEALFQKHFTSSHHFVD